MKLITPGAGRDAWWDGEQTQEQAKEDVDNINHVITADDVEYINDVTLDDNLDVWMGMLEEYHENGRITCC